MLWAIANRLPVDRLADAALYGKRYKLAKVQRSAPDGGKMLFILDFTCYGARWPEAKIRKYWRCDGHNDLAYDGAHDTICDASVTQPLCEVGGRPMRSR